MVENIIYHTVIAIFILVLLIYTFHLKNTRDIYRNEIITFLLQEQFKFPKDRSVFIRGVRAIESELAQKLGVKVCIQWDKRKTHIFSNNYKFFLDIITNKKIPDFLNTPLKSQKVKTILFIETDEENPSSDPPKKKVHCAWEVTIQ